MTTTPDFRELCAELLDELQYQTSYETNAELQDRARAALATPPPEPTTSQITFNDSPTEEVIRLDKEGFHYKGQFIADAGEVHRLMLAFLKQPAKVEPEPPTDEEIVTAFQKGADQEFYATVEALTKYCDAGVELTDSGAREVLYELRRPHIMLDHWGNANAV
jgi:hypothetical protein